MHSWVCYECVKILYVFGIQPKIRSDISDWSTGLDSLFKFFSDKKANMQHKQVANNLLDCILTKTAHTAYFSKLHFGSKQKFVHYEKPILFLVILTWLRQLQQYFFITEEETENCVDWNKHGRYYATPTGNVEIGLGYVHMCTATSDNRTLVDSFSCFIPSSRRRPGVVLSLEEWAANILQLDIPDILEDAKKNNSDTKKRFKRSEKPKKFKFSTIDYSKPTTDKEQPNSPSSHSPMSMVPMSLESISKLSSSEKYKSIAMVLKNGLASAEKKSTGKRKLGENAKTEIDDLKYGADCFISLINDNHQTKFAKLEEVLNHMNEKINDDIKKESILEDNVNNKTTDSSKDSSDDDSDSKKEKSETEQSASSSDSDDSDDDSSK
jgi:hypothetical protein